MQVFDPDELKELHLLVHHACARAVEAARKCASRDLREYAAMLSRLDAKLGNLVAHEYLMEEGETHAE